MERFLSVLVCNSPGIHQNIPFSDAFWFFMAGSYVHANILGFSIHNLSPA
jgi:hypothetical protein